MVSIDKLSGDAFSILLICIGGGYVMIIFFVIDFGVLVKNGEKGFSVVIENVGVVVVFLDTFQVVLGELFFSVMEFFLVILSVG